MGYTMMAVKYDYSISDLGEIRPVVDELINAAKREFLISEEKQFRIKLVMNELLTNCFKHANPSKEMPVEIEAVIDACALSIAVQDHGEGFDADAEISLESSGSDEQVYKDCGRGLLLAHQMASELKFNKKGNLARARIDLLE